MAFSLQMLRAVETRVNEENNSLLHGPLALEQRKEELRRAFAACEIQENEAWIEQAFRLAQVEVDLRRQMCPSKTKRSVLKGAYSFLCACLEQGVVPIQNSTQFAVLRKVPESSRIDVWKEAVDMYDADVTIEVLKSFVKAQLEKEETKAGDSEEVEDSKELEEEVEDSKDPEESEDPEEPEESEDQEDRSQKRAASELPERAAKRSRIEEMETFVTDIQSDEMGAFGEVCGRHWTETMKKDFGTGFFMGARGRGGPR